MPPLSRPRSTRPDSITVGSIRFGVRLSSEGGRLRSPAYLEDVIDDAPAAASSGFVLVQTCVDVDQCCAVPSGARGFQREQGFLAVAGLGRCSGRRRAGGIASGSTGEGSGAALSSAARLMLARTVPELRDPMGRPGFVPRLGARICLSLSAQIPSYAAVRGSWLTGGPHVVVRLLRCSASLFAAGAWRRSCSKLVTAGADGAECARSASTRSPGPFGCWL